MIWEELNSVELELLDIKCIHLDAMIEEWCDNETERIDKEIARD